MSAKTRKTSYAKPQHTPTLECGDPDGDVYPVNQNGLRVAEAFSMEMQEAIVRAVNAHEELLNALKAIEARINGVFDDQHLLAYGALGTTTDDILNIAEQAIAKAEGDDTTVKGK